MAKYKVLRRGDFGYNAEVGDVVEDPANADILISRGFILEIGDGAKVTASLEIEAERSTAATEAADFASRSQAAQAARARADAAAAQADVAEQDIIAAQERAAQARDHADALATEADEAEEALGHQPKPSHSGDDELADQEGDTGPEEPEAEAPAEPAAESAEGASGSASPAGGSSGPKVAPAGVRPVTKTPPKK